MEGTQEPLQKGVLFCEEANKCEHDIRDIHKVLQRGMRSWVSSFFEKTLYEL